MPTALTENPPSVVLAGLGPSGSYYLERLLLRDDCRVVGGTDASASRRDQAGSFLPVCLATPEQFLEDTAVDLFWITGDAIAGRKLAFQAAEAGKHVAIEPGVLGSSRECTELARISREANSRVMVLLPRRCDDDFLRVHAVVASGALGILESLERVVWQLGPQGVEHSRDASGAVPSVEFFDESGFALIDQAILLAGRPPGRVWCHRGRAGSKVAPGVINRVLLEFDAGMTGWLNLTWQTPASLDTGWRIQGRLGSFVDGVQYTATGTGEVVDFPIDVEAAVADEPIATILEHIRGRQPNPGGLPGVWQSLRTLEAAQRSMASGEICTIEPGELSAL